MSIQHTLPKHKIILMVKESAPSINIKDLASEVIGH